MSEYTLSQIKNNDARGRRAMESLLIKEGISLDGNLDYSLGLFDEDYHLVATGSSFKNTLRCMAVDSAHQGEGLLNQVVSALIEHQHDIGNHDLFLYTKVNSAKFFGDLGFYEIARVDGLLVFMENRRDAFPNYLKSLSQFSCGGRCGAVVANANPFTLGHRYLIETASALVDRLFVFVVSEDASLFPSNVRLELVRRGCADLENVTVIPSGDYIISSATFPSYFLKDKDLVIDTHARLDTAVFARIAACLGIGVRFFGEEPKSLVTARYNACMKDMLPSYGIEAVEIPRKCRPDGEIISASTVRELIKEGNLNAVRAMVPSSTYEYIISDAAAPVISALRASEDVRHY